MRLLSGDPATTEEDNVRVFSVHFGKVLNDMNPTNDSVINGINLQDELKELGLPTEWEEFIIVVTDLTNDKDPGLSNAPPNTFKVATTENLLHLFDFIIEFWEDRLDFIKWHKRQVMLVPKNGDLSDPNKCRGLNLMDISAKVFSSIM